MEHLWTAAFEAHEIGKEGNGKACKDVNAEITDKKKMKTLFHSIITVNLAQM